MSENAHLGEETRQRHWQKTRRLTFAILGLWVIFSMIVPWLYRPLNDFAFLGFPLGYFMIAQGSLIAFLCLIVFQNWRQDRIDDEFGVGDE